MDVLIVSTEGRLFRRASNDIYYLRTLKLPWRVWSCEKLCTNARPRSEAMTNNDLTGGRAGKAS